MKSLGGRAKRRNHKRSEIPGRKRLSSLVLNSLTSIDTLAGGIRLRSLDGHSILEWALTLIRS